MNKWTLIGLMAVAGSIGGYQIFPSGFEFGVKLLVNLAKSSPVYEIWSHPPFLTNSTMYLFQVKNPREALTGERVQLKLKGPYEFRVANLKEDAQFSENDQQVELTSIRRFYYEPQGSANIDERFYMLNPILPTTHLLIRRLIMDRIPFSRAISPIVYNVVNVAMDSHGERLFRITSAREALFGYRLRLLSNIKRLIKRFGLEQVAPSIGPPKEMFGVVYFQNTSSDRYLLHTGKNEPHRMGQVLKWRGKSKNNMWRGGCNKLEGTTGEIQSHFLREDHQIPIFFAQACRTIYLEPNGRVNNSVLGIEAIELVWSNKTFQGARSNPSNLCFCKDNYSHECLWDGLIPLEPCFFDVPVFLSRPNFHGADPRIENTTERFDQVDGSYKNAYYVHPITGQIMGAEINLMASFKIQRQQYMRDLENVRNYSFVPFYITRERIQLPPEVGWRLVALTKLANNYGILFLVFGATGGAMTAFGMTKAGTSKKDKKDERERENENENEKETKSDKDENKEDDHSLDEEEALGETGHRGSRQSRSGSRQSIGSRKKSTAASELSLGQRKQSTNTTSQLSMAPISSLVRQKSEINNRKVSLASKRSADNGNLGQTDSAVGPTAATDSDSIR